MRNRRERRLTILIVGALTTLLHPGWMVGQSHAKSASKRGSKPASMERGAVRFRFLDGLRGWAAVVVLLHHLFIDGLPANSFMADRALWAKVFFLNGTLAVSVFFVISGFCCRSAIWKQATAELWAASPPGAICGWHCRSLRSAR